MRHSRVLPALMLAAALPLAAACGVEHGTVTGKDYLPPYTTFLPLYRTQCSGTGTTRTCRSVPSGVYPVEHPDCWQLSLRADDGSTGTTCVSRADYAATGIGAKH
jgi:hypothetical protein